MKRVYVISARVGLCQPWCLRALAVPAASALSWLTQFVSTSALLEQGVSGSLHSGFPPPSEVAGLADIPKYL